MTDEPQTLVRVGVTGHRRIDDARELTREVKAVLAVLRRRYAPPGDPEGGRVRIVAISPIAEGADRLVVHAALEEPGTTLTVALPFPADDYLKDFAEPASRREFAELLARAETVEVLPPTATRDEGYERVGRWIVDHSDAIIALWDGLPSRGRGGTAEIVAYARERDVPVYWIRTNDGSPLTQEL